MKWMIALSFVALSIMVTSPADAKGCLKGAIVGGAAGHYAGHHGLIGAAAGCWIGRREAKTHEMAQEKAIRHGDRGYPNAGPEYH